MKPSGPKELNKLISNIMKPLYKEKGALISKLLENWEQVVGLNFAKQTIPYKVNRIVLENRNYQELVIKVANSSAGVQINFLHNDIIRRITAILGYKAIEKIKILN
ncbi:DUF721 domain-containing protein [Rickettsiales endosymbiont of Stachyamoeba lipophora]|uniref:DUF721 domain-containing protein n=1 Tax=Rickettsiales endosymbiont of Stachyamoeba lipophora TaxID=2486578 RepID=UPI000F64AE54|nr:DUF721 domain-containing protein [Rickettsiales endosymbiont of Stachyamoeba lipophora]AZL15561.1 DUF721 domain-containing protein [Rickettsiales endosymbiont of Stachyamoeba lipophora]